MLNEIPRNCGIKYTIIHFKLKLQNIENQKKLKLFITVSEKEKHISDKVK